MAAKITWGTDSFRVTYASSSTVRVDNSAEKAKWLAEVAEIQRKHPGTRMLSGMGGSFLQYPDTGNRVMLPKKNW